MPPKLTNENCLQGLRCPRCFGEGPFLIQAHCMSLVSDNGTEENTDFEWDNEDGVTCKTEQKDGKYGCGYGGILLQFKEDWQDKTRDYNLNSRSVLRYLKQLIEHGKLQVSHGLKCLIHDVLSKEDEIVRMSEPNDIGDDEEE